MSAAVMASLQRKIQVLAVSLLLVGIAGSVIAVGPVIASPGTHTAASAYNVTFMRVNGTALPASGSGSYFSMVTVSIAVSGANLTSVVFTISYVDQSLSPFTNPAVSAIIEPPNGTELPNVTGQSIPVSASGTTIVLALPNVMPANATVDASSEAEALAKVAGNNTNATVGVGEWTITLDIGAAALGRFRPSGGIQYSIETITNGFVGKASKA